MYLLLVVTLTLAVVAPVARACSTPLSRNEFNSKFCSADAVFKGVPTQGSSSVAIGQNGEQIESARFTFNVVRTFRDVSGILGSSVDVSRSFNRQTDDCDSIFLPETDDGFLIFATGDNYLTVPACGGVLDGDCAPSDIEEINCSK